MALKGSEAVAYLYLQVENKGPLHIGNGEQEIIIDEYYNKPYIPATGIAGAIKAYFKETGKANQALAYLGSEKRTQDRNSSKVNFYDSYVEETVIELRPGLKINQCTGSNEEGHYFNTEYLSSGCHFELKLEAFIKEEEIQVIEELYVEIVQALSEGALRIGGKKTSGGGILEIKSAQKAILNLRQREHLISYVKKDINKHLQPIQIEKTSGKRNWISFELDCETNTSILIKGQATQNNLEADGKPIQNGKLEYIIPGTSLKGAMRGHARKVTNFLNKELLLKELFGHETTEKQETEQCIGSVYFEDIVIQNHKVTNSNRIKIDRFRGGVVSKALMYEQAVEGTLKVRLIYKVGSREQLDETEKKSIALIAFLLRDLGDGTLKLGSGQGIGRGMVINSTLKIQGLSEEIVLDLVNPSQSKQLGLLNEYAKVLNA